MLSFLLYRSVTQKLSLLGILTYLSTPHEYLYEYKLLIDSVDDSMLLGISGKFLILQRPYKVFSCPYISV